MRNSIIFSLLIIIFLLGINIINHISAATLPSNLTYNGCYHHFYKSTPPTPRENCTNTTCTPMCHNGFFATYQNLNIRVPEFSAYYITYEQAWIALANDFPRPSWMYSSAIPTSQQYPISNVLWSSFSGKYDKGHLAPKECFDYSAEACDSTFDMTNVIVQKDTCNQREWMYLETDLRYWIRGKNQSLYVVVAVGYRDFAKPNYTEGIVVPDYMIMAFCDPNASESVALVGVPGADACGGILQKYHTVRDVEVNYLNGTRLFHDDCRPCHLNNSHWFGFFTTKYANGNSTPELCVTTTKADAPSTTTTVVPSTTTTTVVPTTTTAEVSTPTTELPTTTIAPSTTSEVPSTTTAATLASSTIEAPTTTQSVAPSTTTEVPSTTTQVPTATTLASSTTGAPATTASVTTTTSDLSATTVAPTTTVAPATTESVTATTTTSTTTVTTVAPTTITSTTTTTTITSSTTTTAVAPSTTTVVPTTTTTSVDVNNNNAANLANSTQTNNNGSGLNTTTIVLVAVAGGVLLALVAAGIYFLAKNKQKNRFVEKGGDPGSIDLDLYIGTMENVFANQPQQPQHLPQNPVNNDDDLDMNLDDYLNEHQRNIQGQNQNHNNRRLQHHSFVGFQNNNNINNNLSLL